MNEGRRGDVGVGWREGKRRQREGRMKGGMEGRRE